ncbi:MAG: hypothetical protein ABI051_15310 [Vicinamibacterales bacterium]
MKSHEKSPAPGTTPRAPTAEKPSQGGYGHESESANAEEGARHQQGDQHGRIEKSGSPPVATRKDAAHRPNSHHD